MFSYQHVFHAGNHADVLKHAVLFHLLTHVCQKETPCFYIDTHAGQGMYDLQSREARKNEEFYTGIGALWEAKAVPEALQGYLALIRSLNTSGKLRYYPGSPVIADRLLRAQDRLRLFELHPAESRQLDKHVQSMQERMQGATRGKRIMMQKADGFAALKAQLPPPSRRAVTLIDPPYENKGDYQLVMDALADALKRFSSGVFAIWYPLLQRPESRRFETRLKQLPASSWLDVRLWVDAPAPIGLGLTGSAMFILNPPWTLASTLQEIMPFLKETLGQTPEAAFSIESSE